MYLYWLAYAAPGVGDVIEIGSCQGRSTSALAQACRDTGIGVVHAVDTFGGNPGHEDHYVVSASDLSDLEPNFHRNIASAGLTDRVKVYAQTSASAAPAVSEATAPGARMIYIDGEHTYDAVKEEWSCTPR